jgi:ribonuclease HI
MNNKLHIYTDGSAAPNPGPGGWGVVIKSTNSYIEISGGEKFTTNNRMELLSVIKALESIENKNCSIEVYSDSKYVIDSIKKGWVFNWVNKPNFGGKKNEDLWREFLNVYNMFSDLNFNWVKGHNNHPENETCDKLATNESKKFKKI